MAHSLKLAPNGLLHYWLHYRQPQVWPFYSSQAYTGQHSTMLKNAQVWCGHYRI